MDLFPAVKPLILIVDDTPANISLVAGLLHDTYAVKAATNGEAAIDIAHHELPDLILLDIMMPAMDGYEVCRRLKSVDHTRQIPVIFLTSQTEIEDEEHGLELGAVDYITRPINPVILRSRVKAHVADASSARSMRVSNAYLEFEVVKRTRQFLALQDVTVLALASLAETRDSDTGNHLRRTQNYVRCLANELLGHADFGEELTQERIQILYKCAPLHDIGKVGIPDRILLKPGRFTSEEFEVMKTHPALGHTAIVNAQKIAGENLEFLDVARDLVYCHHEKWDGSGYPQGLRDENIPLAARLMAVADVYDALISRRIYKPGMAHDEAVHIIAQGSGSHFDPRIVDAFMLVHDQFRSIAEQYADTDSELQHKADYMNTITGAVAL